jgi:glycosyltransferase involved in cell wall biosynthesis
MSNQLLEVASLRIPVIASNIPQNRGVFNSEEILFFEDGNSNDLREKIEWAFENYTLMQSKSIRAYVRVRTYHDWDNISLKYVEVYEKLMRLSRHKILDRISFQKRKEIEIT